MATSSGVAHDPVRQPWWPKAVGALGLTAQLFVGLQYLASGLIAPPPAVLGLLVAWAALSALALRLFVRRPVWTPLVPVASELLWVAVMALGQSLFGWQA